MGRDPCLCEKRGLIAASKKSINTADKGTGFSTEAVVVFLKRMNCRTL